jgi:hypothetical protein
MRNISNEIEDFIGMSCGAHWPLVTPAGVGANLFSHPEICTQFTPNSGE